MTTYNLLQTTAVLLHRAGLFHLRYNMYINIHITSIKKMLQAVYVIVILLCWNVSIDSIHVTDGLSNTKPEMRIKNETIDESVI